MSAGALRVQAARGVRWTAVSTMATAVAQLVQLVVLGRLLSPRDFGLMGVLLVVVGFALAYTDLGVSAAIVQRQDASRAQLSSLYWLNVGMGVAVFAVVWLTAPWTAAFFRESALIEPLRVVATLFLIVPFGKQFEMLLQKELAFDALARAEVMGAASGTATAVAAAMSGAGVWALVAGVLAGATVKSLALATVGWRRLRPALHFRRADLRGYLAFGAYQVGEQTLNYLSERLDQLLVGRLLGVSSLGLYNFAFGLTSQPVSRINPIVTRVAFPTFCRVQEDRERLRRGFLQMVQMLMTVNAPLLAGLAAVAPVLIPFVFGARWAPAVLLVQLLSILALSRSAGNPVGSVLLALGRADTGFKLNMVLLGFSLPATYAGARLAGAPGIAAALLVVQGVLHVGIYWFVLRPLLGACGREYTRVLLQPSALAAAMAACVAMVPRLAPAASPVLLLAVQIATGAAVYLAAVAAVDRDVLRQLVRMAGARA